MWLQHFGSRSEIDAVDMRMWFATYFFDIGCGFTNIDPEVASFKGYGFVLVAQTPVHALGSSLLFIQERLPGHKLADILQQGPENPNIPLYDLNQRLAHSPAY
jgi:hypothetical protein